MNVGRLLVVCGGLAVWALIRFVRVWDDVTMMQEVWDDDEF